MMRRFFKRALLVLTCCFLHANAVSAEVVDDQSNSIHDTLKIQKLFDEFWDAYYADRRNARKPLNQLKASGLLKKYPRYKPKYLNMLGTYYFSVGEVKKGKQLIDAAIALCKVYDDEEELVKCYNELAIMDCEEGNFRAALPNYQKALTYCIRTKDKIQEGRLRINLAHLYLELEMFQDSERELKNAERILKENGRSRDLLSTYTLLCSFYTETKNDKMLLHYLKLAEPLAHEVNDKAELAVVKSNYAAYFLKHGMISQAKQYYTEALETFKEFNDPDKIAAFSVELGLIELQYGNLQEALDLSNQAVQLSSQDNKRFRMIAAYQLQGQIYEKMGRPIEALQAFKIKTALQDTVKGLEVEKEINRLRVEFETEEKDLENRLLKEQRQLNESKVASQRALIFFLIALSVLMLLGFTLYYKFRRSQQLRKQLELEQKALRAQMNPHFIFNSLNSIQRMYIEGKEDKANDFMADFSVLLRAILNNSGKNSVSIGEEIELSKLYLELEQLRTDHQFTFEFIGTSELNENVQIAPLILQPYLENAVWHGIAPDLTHKGKIIIRYTQMSKNEIIFSIEDNGVGIFTSQQNKPKAKYESKGMHITAQRIGGQQAVKIEELAEGGTKITLKIPVKS
ncbi:MAG: hypothetical protein A3D92_14615 [Bacteroidetes bacterium RIFCSPHIGHO2_02_FULL_44_7]|nr:MAG: hypothetical protein A3D92_14615 [Bacteroidetes bacterium RIFCSPHIGHO2_02_FULL_44_7]